MFFFFFFVLFVCLFVVVAVLFLPYVAYCFFSRAHTFSFLFFYYSCCYCETQAIHSTLPHFSFNSISTRVFPKAQTYLTRTRIAATAHTQKEEKKKKKKRKKKKTEPKWLLKVHTRRNAHSRIPHFSHVSQQAGILLSRHVYVFSVRGDGAAAAPGRVAAQDRTDDGHGRPHLG